MTASRATVPCPESLFSMETRVNPSSETRLNPEMKNEKKKYTYMNELDVRKPLVVTIFHQKKKLKSCVATTSFRI
jgi:hypothetical protein